MAGRFTSDLDDGSGIAAAIADVPRVRDILLDAARAGEAVSYSDMLHQLGTRFTRPKMRALCKTLGAIDRAGAAAGEPELAVLVVRESDGLPGQGWWTEYVRETGYEGPWLGAEATKLVKAMQQEVFRYWRTH
jgi:hypothetical protein